MLLRLSDNELYWFGSGDTCRWHDGRGPQKLKGLYLSTRLGLRKIDAVETEAQAQAIIALLFDAPITGVTRTDLRPEMLRFLPAFKPEKGKKDA